MASPSFHVLPRELGLFGAVMMGLGAVLGTGVFVSIGVAAGVSGAAVLPAIGVAALVAICNGLSSAQLAASHAVSGGTYEYGYQYLTPSLGFTAGWMFLCAKSASAATAALGFAGYFIHVFGLQARLPVVVPGVGIVVAVTVLVASGTRRSNATNILIVTVTLMALTLFVFVAARAAWANASTHFVRPPDGSAASFLQACALMFVAYTGYGRIATMGEEVKEPRRIIPRAIIITMLASAVIYVVVAAVAVGAYGAGPLGEATRATAAPLETVLQFLGQPMVARIVALGAMTAMLGVLLNLVLGLSRVVLAMGRRGDLPMVFARLNAARTTPLAAVCAVGLIIAVLVLIGDVKLTWSFSAFTVLVYYAITNLAALRLPRSQRLYPPIVAWLGLIACLFLAFWVDLRVWLGGLALLAVGLGWWKLRRSRRA